MVELTAIISLFAFQSMERHFATALELPTAFAAATLPATAGMGVQ
jgi:hypothetical protein